MRSASANAPGRVELLGNHTDYNQGVVLAAAIDRGLTMSGSSREDGIIDLRASAPSARVEVALDRIERQTEQRWANYPLGVVQQFMRAGLKVGGFEASVQGDVPAGAGLSSSAAFEVATAGLLMKLFGIRLEPLEVARLCQRAENEFVGVRSGLLDQATSVFGRADHFVFMDFQTDAIRTVPVPPNFALVIADSGKKHSLLQSHYNTRREECAAAAKALGVASLRDVTPERLEEARGTLDPILYKRAAHVVGENARVWQAIDALQAGDAAAIGALMNASHESSRTNFENSTAELDALVEVARSIPRVLGSRLTGGGFGGGTVTLVDAAEAAAVAQAIGARFAERTGYVTKPFVCRIADGAAVGW